MYREAKARLGDPVLRLGRDRRRPGAAPALPAGPRQGRAGPGLAGARRSRSPPPRTCTRSRRTAPTACAGFSPIPAMSMVSHCVGTRFIQLIGGVMTSLLRLVRRPARGQPAGLRRPDRRAGVGRLVGRDLPDDVGLQRPGHPHPGRALDGRGALPRHQGRHGQPRLRRQHQVRRRVAARPGRHRRRARDGDGPRDPQGVLRRPRRCRSSPTTCAPTPTCRSSSASSPERAADGDGAPRARQVPHRRRPRRRRRAVAEDAAWKTVLLDEATGAAGRAERLDGLPLRRVRRGPVEPRPRGRRPRRSSAWPATAPRPSRCCCRASRTPDGTGVGAAPRRARPAGSAATWSPPSST